MAKRKQDLHLDNIEKGLHTLKGIGEAMGETLKTQDVLIDTIDTKVVNSALLAEYVFRNSLLWLDSTSLAYMCFAHMQMDNVTKELKTNNMKLKGLVESVSSAAETATSLPHCILSNC